MRRNRRMSWTGTVPPSTVTPSRWVGLGECWALCTRARVCAVAVRFLIAYRMLAHRTRVSLALFFLRRYGRGVRSPVRVFSSPPRSRCIHVHTVAFLMEHRPTNFTAQRNGELSIMLSSGLTATHHKNTNRHRLVPRSVTYNSRPIRFSDFCYSWSINVSPEANH
ncbi:hypothetical protein F5888DRAFT_877483 [Russula emetica]|nr:hypothetical protein F5888DRAFT_877483 [Russula emetica]